MRYAKITDRGECMSTMNLVVDGVPANKWEWAKYNFYPKNDMVGEVMLVRGFNVLKIMEGIYVPMSPLGIVEISADEYERGKVNNVCTGMDARQQNINDGIEGHSLFQEAFMRPGQQMPSEAEIYYISFRHSAARQGEPLQHRINYMARQLEDSDIVHLPYNHAVTRIVMMVKGMMRDEGWQLNDVDGVSWFLGLTVTAYIRALGTFNQRTDRELFVECFNRYFESLRTW